MEDEVINVEAPQVGVISSMDYVTTLGNHVGVLFAVLKGYCQQDAAEVLETIISNGYLDKVFGE